MKFIDISDIIEEYIELKKDKIDELIHLKEIINNAEHQIDISKDINEIIHNQILNLDVNSRFNYFKDDDIYFKEKYKDEKYRTIKIFNEFDLDKLLKLNENLEKVKETNLEKIFEFDIDKLYNKIKTLINNIKDIKKLDNLFSEKNGKLKNLIKDIYNRK